MLRRSTVKDMLNSLKNENINTWFDLGLFIDKIKENRPVPGAVFEGSFEEFLMNLRNNSIALLTYHFTIDGVTIEAEKYSKVLRETFKIKNIHYISGQFYPGSEEVINKNTKQFELPEIHGFDKWSLYNDFFFTHLERGSKKYNSLIKKYWKQVILIVEKLGSYIEQNNIKLLYLINVCSNPGNVSLSLAVVLLSEYLGIPVISNNHDFFWEGGNKQIDIETKGLEPGPRDFFFKNAHIGEFFSLLEVLFPWESRSWLSVNINRSQTEHLIANKGHNPANVTEINTAVDIYDYSNIHKRRKFESFKQLKSILSRYKKALVGYSVEDVLSLKLVNEKNPEPIIIGHKTKRVNNFLKENIIFLQPTRIIGRKRIEIGFDLIEKLFSNKSFKAKLSESTNLKITLLITGPIPLGQYSYFIKLVKGFGKLQERIPEKLRQKIYLAFAFSELDKEEFMMKWNEPMGIPELYNISSLILLPSETEGRGLPIIEACASGVPIFCRRYYPETVYAEVIGEHLPEKERLKVIEYDGKEITAQQIDEIFQKVFFPHKFSHEVAHNRKVVKMRYSIEALGKNMEHIFKMLYCQLQDNEPSMDKTISAIKAYQELNSPDSETLDNLINTKNRHYLPGEGRLAFMNYLKSLIDPSFFRVEEQENRGYVFEFAFKLLKYNPNTVNIDPELIHEFYNCIDNIFKYSDGETSLRHDHSFSYRHRNKKYFPFQDFTLQELTGLITLIYHQLIQPDFEKEIVKKTHFFTDWNLALSQLTSSTNLAIDDRYKLKEKLKSNLPIAFFPGKYVRYELEFLGLQSIKTRLGLKIEEELKEEHILTAKKPIEPFFVFTHKLQLGQISSKKEILRFLQGDKDPELNLLYRHHLIQLVDTNQLTVGIHLNQIGESGLQILRQIKEKGGYLISNRRNAVFMSDMIDIDRFHIGRVTNEVGAGIMGIPKNSGYIIYIPAGLRTTLAYPTPIQTALDFSRALKSEVFKNLVEKMGEEKVLRELKNDAETKGSPIKMVLENLSKNKSLKSEVEYEYVTGVYKDGYPWNGAIARVNLKKNRWTFTTASSAKTKKVTSFVKDFENKHHKKIKIAWNGGYILNPELVGKLGLPESYIGSPLGLLISNGKVLSAPLFNKPALIINESGNVEIRRVNCSKGIILKTEKQEITFPKNSYNQLIGDYCYYDLMHNEEEIPGDGRVIVRLAGNTVKDIIKTKKGEHVKIIPVGLTLSFHPDKFPSLKIGKSYPIQIVGLENVEHAVEAGPLLLSNGKMAVDMEKEGWKTQNSIRTQAARLDFTDMRGPKIAVGTDDKDNLAVLAINGRIRESVGATHIDMAEILLKFGMKTAMGFDPGGSSTLVVEGKTLNISPYNKEYEKNLYSLPPEQRAVANAVMGYVNS